MSSRVAPQLPNGHGYHWLTVEEVAARVRVHPQSVYREIRRGELIAARVGRSLRIDVHELDRYLRAGGGAP